MVTNVVVYCKQAQLFNVKLLIKINIDVFLLGMQATCRSRGEGGGAPPPPPPIFFVANTNKNNLLYCAPPPPQSKPCSYTDLWGTTYSHLLLPMFLAVGLHTSFYSLTFILNIAMGACPHSFGAMGHCLHSKLMCTLYWIYHLWTPGVYNHPSRGFSTLAPN